MRKTINNRLWRNSSDPEFFHGSKIEYETGLRNSGYKNVDFKYNLVHKNNNKRSRQRNIIWFNPPFSQAVSTNIVKLFLDSLDKHSPWNNQLHKIFKRNIVKVSYSCTPIVGPLSSHTIKTWPMLKTRKRNIVTIQKSKNVCWKVNVDLRISYTNVQLQQQVIHQKFT